MMPCKFFYVSKRSDRPRYRFVAGEVHRWPAWAKDLAMAAIAVVWDSHVARPVEFGIGFYDFLPGAGASTGATIASAAFVADDCLFQLALTPITVASKGAHLDLRVIEAAAHEAVHAVQEYRGVETQGAAADLTHPDDLTAALNRYQESPIEQEANHIADLIRVAFEKTKSGTQHAKSAAPPQDYVERWKRHLEGRPLYSVSYLDLEILEQYPP